jgi:hypothetical protein
MSILIIQEQGSRFICRWQIWQRLLSNWSGEIGLWLTQICVGLWFLFTGYGRFDRGLGSLDVCTENTRCTGQNVVCTPCTMSFPCILYNRMCEFCRSVYAYTRALRDVQSVHTIHTLKLLQISRYVRVGASKRKPCTRSITRLGILKMIVGIYPSPVIFPGTHIHNSFFLGPDFHDTFQYG